MPIMRIMDVNARIAELGERVNATSPAIIRDDKGMPRAVKAVVVSHGSITFVTGRLMLGDISADERA